MSRGRTSGSFQPVTNVQYLRDQAFRRVGSKARRHARRRRGRT